MSKSVNVDFVTRQIEVDTDGKEHFISAAMAAKDAEQSAFSAQNAANTAEKIATDLGLVDEAVQTAVASAEQASNSATAASNKADAATTKASEASTSAATAIAKAEAASTSATNAAQSYANADAVATQLTEYLATKETLTAPAVDKTLLIDGAAADSKVVGELKNDLSELNIIPIMNKIIKIDAGHYWSDDGFLYEASGWDAVTIEVEGGKSYSINMKFLGAEKFNVFTDINGNVLGKYTSDNVKEIGDGWYFTAPANAKYLKLTSGTTTYWNFFIVIEGVHDISKVTIQDYPIGEVKEAHINVPFELMDGTVVDSELKKHENHLADLDSIVGRVVYQYIDKTQYNDGHFWGMNAGTHKVGLGDNQYFSAVKVENVPKGEYKISKDISNNYTFIENIETGSFDSISSFYTTSGDSYNNINVDFNFNLYLTIDYWRDKELFMLVDGDMPSQYVFGKYDIDLSNAYLGNKVPVVIYCGASRDYTTLKSAIEKATEYMDATVYVDDGTYDLVEEFGTEYLDSYIGTDNIGLILKNMVRVVFSSGAKVVFDYQGTNEKVHEYFSPFNSGKYGFTLENAYVESKNCRYSVHDERAHDTDSYHNTYKHCTFIHDSSQASGWHGAQAIGGGLGKYGDILIEDCYCKSVSNDDTISYHSTTISEEGNDAKSKIVVRGTYTSGTLDFIQLGNSNQKTQILVSGCNLRIAPKIEGSVNTMELISWGNTIRE